MKNILEVMNEFMYIYPERLKKLPEVEDYEREAYEIDEKRDYLIWYDVRMKDNKLYKFTIHAEVEEGGED